ncbi:MAG: RNA polymerase sigma factor [Candidatus Scalindua sp.]
MEIQVDTESVRLAREGDSAAFEELVERNYMYVYKISYKWTGIKEDAEDITQDVFMKLARSIQTFKESSSFQTWLYSITINTAKDFTKKSARMRTKEIAFSEQQNIKDKSTPEETSIAEIIQYMITKLPHKLKETALLVFSEGMSHKEAAVVLNSTEKTISWRIFQVKKKLKSHLKTDEVLW